MFRLLSLKATALTSSGLTDPFKLACRWEQDTSALKPGIVPVI